MELIELIKISIISGTLISTCKIIVSYKLPMIAPLLIGFPIGLLSFCFLEENKYEYILSYCISISLLSIMSWITYILIYFEITSINYAVSFSIILWLIIYIVIIYTFFYSRKTNDNFIDQFNSEKYTSNHQLLVPYNI